MSCYIEDDGVGRQRAVEITGKNPNHKSRGVELTKLRLMKLSPKQKENNVFKIIDLKDSKGNSLGTRIELLMPIKYQDAVLSFAFYE